MEDEPHELEKLRRALGPDLCKSLGSERVVFNELQKVVFEFK
jgi:hypothetical protein